MTDTHWRDLLRTADAAGETALSPEAAASIRRSVVAAVDREPAWAPAWPRAWAVAATIVLMIAAGVGAGRRLPPGEPVASNAAHAWQPAAERRQLHFSTPGGTRIIWVFNSELELKGTTP
jgi:hypothetical protein